MHGLPGSFRGGLKQRVETIHPMTGSRPGEGSRRGHNHKEYEIEYRTFRPDGRYFLDDIARFRHE